VVILPGRIGLPRRPKRVVLPDAMKAGLVQKVGPHPQTVRILPVLPGLTPQTDTTIAATTKARMDKVWNYYKAMYDKPQDNIVPLDPAAL
jgi:hypothetical protein